MHTGDLGPVQEGIAHYPFGFIDQLLYGVYFVAKLVKAFAVHGSFDFDSVFETVEYLINRK